MCARLIVIVGIRAKDAAQVLLAEHHEVVNALAADRANQPFGKTVLPRRTVAKSACREYPSLSNGA